jgi:hypothetical protein
MDNITKNIREPDFTVLKPKDNINIKFPTLRHLEIVKLRPLKIVLFLDSNGKSQPLTLHTLALKLLFLMFVGREA